MVSIAISEKKGIIQKQTEKRLLELAQKDYPPDKKARKAWNEYIQYKIFLKEKQKKDEQKRIMKARREHRYRKVPLGYEIREKDYQEF